LTDGECKQLIIKSLPSLGRLLASCWDGREKHDRDTLSVGMPLIDATDMGGTPKDGAMELG
jgi:hypothetical protein